MNCHFRLQGYLKCDCNFLIYSASVILWNWIENLQLKKGKQFFGVPILRNFCVVLGIWLVFCPLSLSLSLSLMLNCLMFCILQCHVLPVLFISSDESNLFLFLSILNIFFCFCFCFFFLCEMKCFKLQVTIFILALIS